MTIEGSVGSDLTEDALEREFRPANYRRSFELPEFVDREKVSAQLDQGVLTLHLPKAEAVKPRRIEIRPG